MNKIRFLPITLALSIAILCAILYVPYLHNALVFDDKGLFNGLIYDYAYTPLDFRPRTFPYFSLGFIQVIFGSIEANRIVSLVLHILCSWMLFALLLSLLTTCTATTNSTIAEQQTSKNNNTILAGIGAILFAVNPVAVYGAGYLAQRTILFSTLFSLLSFWFFNRAFAKNRTADIVTAAVLYAAAVFSKEHAVMLPWAVAPIATLYDLPLRTKIKRVFLYFILCAPAAIGVVIAAKSVIATSYEPDVNNLLSQMKLQMHSTALDTKSGQWAGSILLQMGFFFDYIGYWFIPNVTKLSADMRFDFVALLTSWVTYFKAACFLICPAVAIYVLRHRHTTALRNTAALLACGFLYAWFLYFTELVAIRFQEPFVLYRSYIWAPGYILMGVALCRLIPARFVAALTVPIAVPILAVFLFFARDRLQSLSNQGSLWLDAAAKLPAYSIPGDDRIFYNRGLEYQRQKKYDDAIQDFSYVIRKNPTQAVFYYVRGVAFYSKDDFPHALHDFTEATHVNPKDGASYLGKGMTLEKLHQIQEAKAAYQQSAALGNTLAKLHVEKLEKSFQP